MLGHTTSLAAITAELSSVATTADLATAVAPLASQSWVTGQLTGYPSTGDLTTALAPYASQSWVSSQLGSYATTAAMTTAVSGLATTGALSATNALVSAINLTLPTLATTSALSSGLAGITSTLTSYATLGALSGYATTTALTTAISGITATSLGALTASSPVPAANLTGTVPLGILPAIPTTQITGLAADLAGIVSLSTVQGLLYTSSMVKQADYVATTAVTAGGSGAPAGLQTVDGITTPVGARVLCTAQPSSVNNGIWVVTTIAWTRPPDFFTNNWLAQDSLTLVTNETGSAAGVHDNTIWQATAASGVIDTAANNWVRIGYIAPPFVPVAGNGLTISSSTFSARVVTGGGVLAGGTGLSIDPNIVPRKYIGAVPSGSTTATVTHNLNSNYPTVSVWATGSNSLVLAGVPWSTPTRSRCPSAVP